jgi:GMP synthase (glutamine-hydrolysing)
MREGETEFVEGVFHRLGATHFRVERAQEQFLKPLAGVCDPEEKRHIIGHQFVEVQERVLHEGHFLEGNWILGQGTIYPDTIESGGTAKADVIKTHHNRVAGIQRLIEAGRLIEPLTQFYKDEVRSIGRELGIDEEILERHPFPGPGLAIRCLCGDEHARPQRVDEGWVLPVHSVGVQGDSRSYRPVLAVDHSPSPSEAAELVNRISTVNRIVQLVRSHAPIPSIEVTASTLSAARLDRLRRADAVVRRVSHETGFDKKVWQFPVVLIPAGIPGRPDSVVLRPIDSVDGMTAQVMRMEASLLDRLAKELLSIDGVCAVFYDLTNKPPATIEWE